MHIFEQNSILRAIFTPQNYDMSHTINILFLFGSKRTSGHKYALLPKEMTHDIINEKKAHFLFMPR